MTTATLQLSTLLLLFTTVFVDTSRTEDSQTIFLQLRNGMPRSVSFAQVASNETVRAKTLENLSSYERYIMLGTAGTNLMAGWIYRMLLFKNIWQNDVRRPINLLTGTSPKLNSSINNKLPNSDRKRIGAHITIPTIPHNLNVGFDGFSGYCWICLVPFLWWQGQNFC